ncbi:IPT/TIG domain-containing protein [Nocardioides abyssi]|uniref:IPT/TIG domain-containing protein n=1 Tax=Nocardioides abyssi TaxID=3058370 RepID=A0ABT8EP08_9ACTN|nr:IPT/TIG domain-containing protein [Nocardioides abyssi]MDN4159885.1 IPT/TIG domain-containing protein [Nocardioides abyssi]
MHALSTLTVRTASVGALVVALVPALAAPGGGSAVGAPPPAAGSAVTSSGPAAVGAGRAATPRPRITGVAPASGPTAGGARVVIRGKNLAAVGRVTVGGRRAVVLSRRRDRVVVRTPEAGTCARTSVQVRVHARGVRSRTGPRSRYTYLGRTVTPAVAGGEHVSVALRRDGVVLAWGSGSDGVLGQGHTGETAVPVRVRGLGCVQAVAAGSKHVAALTAGGAVWSWGSARMGQAGDGYLGIRLRPSRAHLGARVVQISAAGDKTVALTASGVVAGWGWETAGELGRGRYVTKTPVVVDSFREVREVVAGAANVLVVRRDGSLWGTGSGAALAVDADSSTTRPFEVAVPGDVVGVRVGRGSVHAVTSDGALWGWGLNAGEAAGAVGLGHSGPPVRTPTATSLTQVVAVAGTTPQGLALRDDGSVWGWGWCLDCDPAGGAPGEGTRYAPTQVPGLTDVVRIAAAHGRFHAIHADGRLSVWGRSWVLPGGDIQQVVPVPTTVPGVDLRP